MKRFGTGPDSLVKHRPVVILRGERLDRLNDDVAGVDPFIHMVNGDSKLLLSIDECPVENIAPTVSGELPCMAVDEAKRGVREE